MKKAFLFSLVLFVGFCLATSSFAADKKEIEKAVSSVVLAGVYNDTACKAKAPEGLYIFVMKTDGKLLVHPSKDAIKDLSTTKYKVIYDELIKATSDGLWVQYQWKGKEKNTFVKKHGDKIVGCGY
ncbi:Cache domain-containing protein [Desulfocicer vacuolatum DSM 3385]|uniref:Cache domain-containing protein n=1 Tax=Desulfocicer vacuolatum DSM 3385 TaxID=1121400 RepID=A0A1W2AQV0_9BACT|nr:cache domain-containing protein [Desulfocicer vacuolatum]SMC63119.1 Cache domain-containing protein [Desulfocicer vacuolatum DSM 3385]